jgi:hypothetical protein
MDRPGQWANGLRAHICRSVLRPRAPNAHAERHPEEWAAGTDRHIWCRSLRSLRGASQVGGLCNRSVVTGVDRPRAPAGRGSRRDTITPPQPRPSLRGGTDDRASLRPGSRRAPVPSGPGHGTPLRADGGAHGSARAEESDGRIEKATREHAEEPARLDARHCCRAEFTIALVVRATPEGLLSASTVRGVTWKPRAERGHRVQSDAIEPRAGSHYVRPTGRSMPLTMTPARSLADSTASSSKSTPPGSPLPSPA